jgi:hypothetical protein
MHYPMGTMTPCYLGGRIAMRFSASCWVICELARAAPYPGFPGGADPENKDRVISAMDIDMRTIYNNSTWLHL